MSITKETRRESYKQIKLERGKRHHECLQGLRELKEATANELAMHLFSKKLTPFFNRNYVHPRLNELMEDNKVEVIGKKKDSITERTSAIYTLVAS